MKACIHINGGLSAELTRDDWSRNSLGSLAYAQSLLLVCPFCLAPWAKLRVETDEEFTPIATSCIACARPTDYAPVPGSILRHPGLHWELQFDESLLQALPRPLLEQEFDLHLKAIEQWNQQSNQLMTF